MKLKPGSIAWLMRHEVRMFYFRFGGSKGRGLGGVSAWVLGAGLLVAHVIAWSILSGLDGAHAAAGETVAMIVSAVMFGVLTLMLSNALSASVEALFERGDLDLLLSSPLPTRSVFAVRLGAVAVGVSSLYLALLGPFANMGLVLGQFRWLAIYPCVISMGVITACVAMQATLALVRAIGVRRTRVVAQLLGAISGAGLFLLSQLPNMSRGKFLAWLEPLLEPGAPLGPGSLAWFPGRALLGNPLPLLVLSTLAAAAYFLTVGLLHRVFAHGVQESAPGTPAATQDKPLRLRFHASVLRNVVLKEWRLIARDPQLISQVLLQLLYMMPLCVALLTGSTRNVVAYGFALPFLCASLCASLGWLAISAEDAPDLLAASPCPASAIQRAKLVAVALPPLAIVALPLAWLAGTQPKVAGVLACCILGATAMSGILALKLSRPAPRSEFKQRGRSHWVANAAELANGIAWGALGAFLASQVA